MNARLEHWMADVTRLTRTGQLTAATAAIQAALGGAVPAAASTDPLDVIDVDARWVDVQPPDAARVADARPVQHGPAAGRFLSGSHTSAAGTRNYKLFVPPQAGMQPLPLVVMLHGCTQNADDFAAGTGMNDAALRQGFFVLYPEQTQSHNPSRCWNWFKHNHQQRGRGEPELLAGMTRHVMAQHPIDPRRVYVAGLSAGGAMAAILGQAYPDLFAAIGVHSGLPPGAARDVTSAFQAMKEGASGTASGHTPPTIVFHGDADKTVHPVNGRRIADAGSRGATAQTEHARSDNGRLYTREVYRDASGRIAVEHWRVHGAGHAWSGGRPEGTYTDRQGPDATAAMLKFFFAQDPGR
jgi:poly(hydroxyalkanoate) depolymerase family esterase